MRTKKAAQREYKPGELVMAYQLAAKVAAARRKEIDAIFREFGARR